MVNRILISERKRPNLTAHQFRRSDLHTNQARQPAKANKIGYNGLTTSSHNTIQSVLDNMDIQLRLADTGLDFRLYTPYGMRGVLRLMASVAATTLRTFVCNDGIVQM
jgi:hypothetical protein